MNLKKEGVIVLKILRHMGILGIYRM